MAGFLLRWMSIYLLICWIAKIYRLSFFICLFVWSFQYSNLWVCRWTCTDERERVKSIGSMRVWFKLHRIDAKSADWNITHTHPYAHSHTRESAYTQIHHIWSVIYAAKQMQRAAHLTFKRSKTKQNKTKHVYYIMDPSWWHPSLTLSDYKLKLKLFGRRDFALQFSLKTQIVFVVSMNSFFIFGHCH